MDALAIRLGMWDWGQGFHFNYFGVPYANFWAWFWVIFFFSSGYRLAGAFRARVVRAASPLIAVAVGLAGVLGTNALIAFAVPFRWHGPLVAATLVSALVVLLAQRVELPSASPPPAWAVPLGFHLYFLAAGLLSGVIFDPPFLLLVSGLMLALALWLHRRRASRHTTPGTDPAPA
jgi:hypothetical protein